MDHPPHSPDLAPADFWRPQNSTVCWKESVPRALGTLDHLWKKILTDVKNKIFFPPNKVSLISPMTSHLHMLFYYSLFTLSQIGHVREEAWLDRSGVEQLPQTLQFRNLGVPDCLPGHALGRVNAAW
jgi:hypothetical protein